MRTQLVVMASLLGSLAVAEAGPAKPTLAEAKAYVINAKGNMVPYSQEFTGKDELGIWDTSMTFAVHPCKAEIKVGGSLQETISVELAVV